MHTNDLLLKRWCHSGMKEFMDTVSVIIQIKADKDYAGSCFHGTKNTSTMPACLVPFSSAIALDL